MKIRVEGAYVIKSAESRPKAINLEAAKAFQRVPPTDQDRALAAAVRVRVNERKS